MINKDKLRKMKNNSQEIKHFTLQKQSRKLVG